MDRRLDGPPEGDNMLVAVRLRPLTDKEKQQGQRSCCRVVGDQAVIIEKTSHGALLRSQQSFEKEYAFDVAFPEDATQAEVYTKTVQDVVPTILNGYHATVFAYGATGAGKTHTMMGSERDGLGPDVDDSEVSVDGIIPQALTDVFNLIEHRQVEEEYMKLHHGTTFEWQVLVSYLEVYNEQIRDLLRPSAKPLALREDAARGIVHVAGLHHEEAHSVSEVLQLLRRGNRHRKTEPTAANQVSSRSHAVIQVTVRHTTTTMISNTIPRKSVIEGKLSLIDLAGSERASSTLNRGLRLTEGANINKSLLALANCINSLSTQNRQIVRRNSMDCMSNVRKERGSGEGMLSRFRSSKVQYRDSKLTHLLKNSLEGDCRLVMIANINPSHTSFDESHNTLKYANRAKNIKVRPRMHVTTAQMSYEQRIEKLEKENVVLRTALTEAYEDLGYEPHEQPVPLDFGRTGARSPGIPQRKVCPRRPSVQEPESDDTETDSDGSISTSLKQRDEELAQMRASAMQREAELSRLRNELQAMTEEKSKLQDTIGQLLAEKLSLEERMVRAQDMLTSPQREPSRTMQHHHNPHTEFYHTRHMAGTFLSPGGKGASQALARSQSHTPSPQPTSDPIPGKFVAMPPKKYSFDGGVMTKRPSFDGAIPHKKMSFDGSIPPKKMSFDDAVTPERRRSLFR